MKLTIEQKPLHATLKRLSGIVENRNTIPILAHVAITANANNTVTLKATDLDIEATATIAATVETPGATTVSARTLADFVGKLAAGSLVSLSIEDDRLTVKAGRASFKLSTLPIGDFPSLSSDEWAANFTLDASDLSDLLGGTIFAASTEETRYYLNGPYLHPLDGNILAVATDGHKLAKIGLDKDAEFPPVIIPRKTANETVKSFTEGDVELSVSAHKIRFASQSFTILSKVIDGTFPDCARVIPTENKNVATVNTDELRAALSRVMAATEDKSKAVKLSITDGEIIVSARSSASSATDAVNCTLNGEPCDIGFNGAYLTEILAQIEGDVSINYADGLAPALFRGDSAALYLCMPMRVA